MDFRQMLPPTKGTTAVTSKGIENPVENRASLINFGFAAAKLVGYETDKYLPNRFAPPETMTISSKDMESAARLQEKTQVGLKMHFQNDNIPLTDRVPNKLVDDSGQKTTYIPHKTGMGDVYKYLSKNKKK